MAKTYTRTGDDGTTGRFGGKRIGKHSLLSEVLGALDEVNAALGMSRAALRGNTQNAIRNNAEELDVWLRELQDTLFRIGADLSTPLGHPGPLASRITADDTVVIEQKIDALDEKLPELRQFILPGGTETAAALHLARATIRRAERALVCAVDAGEQLNPALKTLLNRLSSYLFALARYANHIAGHQEEHPKYNS